MTGGPDVEGIRARLLEQLRRAADAGFVTLRAGADGAADQGDSARAPEGTDPEPLADTAAGPVAGPESGPVTGMPSTGTPVAGSPIAGGDGASDVGDIVGAGSGLSIVRATVPELPVVAETGLPGGGPGAAPADGALAEATIAPEAPDAPYPAGNLIVTAPAAACFQSLAFRFSDPLPPAALSREFARLRRDLIGEFDRANVPVVLSLARLYLAHGLGVEALAVLDQFAPDTPDTRLLAALAWLVEDRPLPVPNILSVPGCTGQHALWQAFDAALASRPAEALEHEAAAAGALEQTARGLRGRIAVTVGLAAADQQDWLAAHRLNAMAKRALADDDRSGNANRLLLEAALARRRGDAAGEQMLLNRLRGARSSAGREAVLALAALAVDAPTGNGAPDDRLRLDLGIVALMHRDTDIGERAFLAEVDITGWRFGLDAGLALLAYGLRGKIIGKAAHRAALAHLGAFVPERGGDTPLALVYEASPQRFAGALAEFGFRSALARSYVGLGAPALGEAVLHSGDLSDANLAGGLAQAYLEIGDGDAAARLSAGLPDGPERAGLEAGVALALGDAAGALPDLDAAGAPAALRARTAWSAGNWEASAGALAEQISALASVAGEAENSAAEADAAGVVAPESPAATLVASLAVRQALAARRAGVRALPDGTAEFVAARPRLRAGLEAMFSVAVGRSEEISPAEVPEYLSGVESEMRVFEELLNNG